VGADLKLHQETITIEGGRPGLRDVTDPVRRVVAASGIRTGLCNVFIQHTSASLVVQENADPAVLRDLERFLARLAPENADYEHDTEGPDDMPSHIRSALTRTAETLPVSGGNLALGTWQALYLWEHRRAPHRRHLVITLWGD
jgi:secondary thiamine-phosphate synthase enzyme